MDKDKLIVTRWERDWGNESEKGKWVEEVQIVT